MRKEVLQFLPLASATVTKGPRVLAVITPWAGTWVPWYTIALALLMAARGCKLSLVIDGFVFGEKPWRHAFVMRCLLVVMRVLQVRFDVSLLSTAKESATVAVAPPSRLVLALADMNTTWQLRGEMIKVGRQQYLDRCAAQLGLAEAPIEAMLSGETLDVLLIPGGVFGTSGLWVAHARAKGLRICSFDAGSDEVGMFSALGVACHLHDIPDAFRRLKSQGTQAEQAFAYRAAQDEMAKRRKGVDAFASQIAGAGSGDARHDGAILIALNSSWDAAALGLHTVFKDNSQWIVETVRHVLARTDNNVIVRQHPAERLPIGATSDDYRELLLQNFGNEPRLHFVAAADRINSYDLLSRVALVVTYTSTIGIEAAAFGRPVVSPSMAYYTGLGFTWKASGLADYQAMILAGASGHLQVTTQMREDAHLCYYLTQCCNWFFSPFSPGNFSRWSQIGLKGLHQDAQVQLAIKSLTSGIPWAYLNHQQRFQHSAGANASVQS
jgi:hypothetical protein